MTGLRLSLDDKYRAEQGRCLLSGVQALVRLPLDQARLDRRAGLKTGGFISGYRGSPLGGYDQQLMRNKHLLDAHNIHFQPGINEDLAATAVWGSQQVNLHPGALVDGVFGLWYGKAPGVDRSGDVFKHANMTGIWRHGGVLAIAGDDPVAKSSTLPSQSEFAFIDAEIPVLSPSCVQEVLDLGLHGIAMSRFSGLWVGMIAMADTMDGSATVNVDPSRLALLSPEDDGSDRHITLAGLKLQNRHGAEERLRLYKIPAAKRYARANKLNQIIWDCERPRLGLIASGKNWLALLDALRLLGIDEMAAKRLGIRLMKVAMPWPLDEATMLDFAQGLEKICVIEAKRPLIETQLKDQLYYMDAARRPSICGKRDASGAPLLSEIGELEAEDVAAALVKILPPSEISAKMAELLRHLEERQSFGAKLATPSPRTPYFCSGCPHNSSTAVPEGSRSMAGIGCHIMAQTMPGRSEDSFSQMGGEGVPWIGQIPFTETRHVFANLGDGTYHHSGSLAIRAAVAAKANITYKILYNDAVAMTGGQHVDGPLSVAQITHQLAAEGVKRIAVVAEEPERHNCHDLAGGATIHSRDDLNSVQTGLREYGGVSVLIYDQTCAAEKRRRRKRGEYAVPTKRLFINDRVCEDCGDCSTQSNCISIEPLKTAFGTKRQINQSSCNMDYSCAKGFCPSFVEIEGAALKSNALPPEALIEMASAIPAARIADCTGDYKILLTGIGGNGTTTISAILAMAAHLDGKQVATLDVTGLAQKGGAVLSYLAIAPADAAAPTAKIAAGGADCIIAGDLVVAASAASLALCDDERTVAIADDDIAPTAEFTMFGTQGYRTSRPQMRLRNAVRNLIHDHVRSTAQQLLGDMIYANMMLAGMAFQHGCLPLSQEAIEQAIALNGAAAKTNLAAFHAGRILAAKPDLLASYLHSADATPQEDLNGLIERLATELTAYQNEAYAERFRQLTAHMRNSEIQASNATVDATRLPLTEAVARNFYKLLAYKDEYEVARLYADPAFRQKLAATFEDGKKLSILLAPPLLSRTDPATGRPRKIRFGSWIFPVFTMLAKFKILRGTPLDPFGWTAERRSERQLADDYEQTVLMLSSKLSPANLDAAVEIAELPKRIKGFGPVKARNINEVRELERKLLAEFHKLSEISVWHETGGLIAAE